MQPVKGYCSSALKGGVSMPSIDDTPLDPILISSMRENILETPTLMLKAFRPSGAIFLAQLENIIADTETPKLVDGHHWIRNSYRNWAKIFGNFWQPRAMAKIVTRLESTGVLLSRQDLNKGTRNRTKWYTIDYDAYYKLCREFRREAST